MSKQIRICTLVDSDHRERERLFGKQLLKKLQEDTDLKDYSFSITPLLSIKTKSDPHTGSYVNSYQEHFKTRALAKLRSVQGRQQDFFIEESDPKHPNSRFLTERNNTKHIIYGSLIARDAKQAGRYSGIAIDIPDTVEKIKNYLL